VLDQKFACMLDQAQSELLIQKAHSKYGLASVLLDSEARPSPPQAPANFGIGTLVEKAFHREACAFAPSIQR
jgi:hypothetical protein